MPNKPSKDKDPSFQEAVEGKMQPTVYGYAVRKPFEGEDKYFKENPDTAGMATEDGQIVLNPYSTNTPEQQQAVAQNEAIRLWLRQNEVDPDFEVTEQQIAQFKGKPYANPENIKHLRHTLIARILTGDSSAGDPTPQQLEWAKKVAAQMGVSTSKEK